MTEKLAKRVEMWQKRLGPLGLTHKRIDFVRITDGEDEMPGSGTAQAGVQPGHNYDSVKFFFAHDFVESATQQQIDETILHEWIHVAMRDFDVAIEAVNDELAGGARYHWNERVQYERESLVDRLARQIYAAYNDKTK